MAFIAWRAGKPSVSNLLSLTIDPIKKAAVPVREQQLLEFFFELRGTEPPKTKREAYFKPTRVSGFVASIFFAFFKVFLAILFSLTSKFDLPSWASASFYAMQRPNGRSACGGSKPPVFITLAVSIEYRTFGRAPIALK